MPKPSPIQVEIEIRVRLKESYGKHSDTSFMSKVRNPSKAIRDMIDGAYRKQAHDLNAQDKWQTTVAIGKVVVKGIIGIVFAAAGIGVSAAISAASLGTATVFVVPIVAVASGLAAYFTGRAADVGALLLEDVRRRSRHWIENHDYLYGEDNEPIREDGKVDERFKMGVRHLDMMRVDAATSVRLAVVHFQATKKAKAKLDAHNLDKMILSDGDAATMVRRYMSFAHEARKTENYLAPCLDLSLSMIEEFIEAIEQGKQTLNRSLLSMHEFLRREDHGQCECKPCLFESAGWLAIAGPVPDDSSTQTASQLLEKDPVVLARTLQRRLLDLRKRVYADYSTPYATTQIPLNALRDLYAPEWREQYVMLENPPEKARERALSLYALTFRDYEDKMLKRPRNYVRNWVRKFTGAEIATAVIKEGVTVSLIATSSAVTAYLGASGAWSDLTAKAGTTALYYANQNVHTLATTVLTPFGGDRLGSGAAMMAGKTIEGGTWLITQAYQTLGGAGIEFGKGLGEKAAHGIVGLIDGKIHGKQVGDYFDPEMRRQAVLKAMSGTATSGSKVDGKEKAIAKKLSDRVFEEAATHLYAACAHLNCATRISEGKLQTCADANTCIDHLAGYAYHTDCSMAKLYGCIDLVENLLEQMLDCRKEEAARWLKIRVLVESWFHFDRLCKTERRVAPEPMRIPNARFS